MYTLSEEQRILFSVKFTKFETGRYIEGGAERFSVHSKREMKINVTYRISDS